VAPRHVSLVERAVDFYADYWPEIGYYAFSIAESAYLITDAPKDRDRVAEIIKDCALLANEILNQNEVLELAPAMRAQLMLIKSVGADT
jgi:hypothetical protein